MYHVQKKFINMNTQKEKIFEGMFYPHVNPSNIITTHLSWKT
jgi:hypothetical protein